MLVDFLLICFLFSAHIQQLTTQPNAQPNAPAEQKLRRQKEMMEQMLNQKVLKYLYIWNKNVSNCFLFM